MDWGFFTPWASKLFLVILIGNILFVGAIQLWSRFHKSEDDANGD